jgi:hypothetical protein
MAADSITLHELGFTLPQATSHAGITPLVLAVFGIADIDPDTLIQPKGRNGYRRLYILKSDKGGELVSILTGGVGEFLKDLTTVIIHGAALETGDLDPVAITQYVLSKNGWGTSAHLAADSYDLLTNWEEIKHCCKYENYRTRIKTRLCKPSKDKKTGEMRANPPVLLTSNSETIYLGKQKSSTCVCLYNERGFVRVEIRIRDRGQVTDLFQKLAAGENIGPIASGIIRHNLTFIEAAGGRKDQREDCQWWLDFLDNADSLTLSKERPSKHRSPWYVPLNAVQRRERTIRKELEGKNGEQIKAMLLRFADELQLIEF